MLIQTATIDDLPKIVEIYNESIPDRQATADTVPIKVEDRIAWFNAHSKQRPLWVIIENEIIMGWLSLHDFYGRPAYKKTVEISVYVSKQHQKKGLAKQLVQHCFANISELEINTILAFVFAHNIASLELFKKFGFLQWGYLPQVAELDEQQKDVVILGWQ